MDLTADPPADPDASRGYLDLLVDAPATDATPKNTGAIQAAWASGLGSMLYDNAQAFARKLVSAWQLPIEWLDIPTGGVALDVGSGPGNVTASLARAAGPDGLALGVDISEPMLARAVDAQAGPQRRLPPCRRAAAALPRRDVRRGDLPGCAAVDPRTVGHAGGDRAGAASPAAGSPSWSRPPGRGAEFLKWLPNGGVHFFTEDELGDTFEDLGLVGVRTKTLGNIQWVRGRRPVTLAQETYTVDSTREHRRNRPRRAGDRRRHHRHHRAAAARHPAGVRGDPGVGGRRDTTSRHG